MANSLYLALERSALLIKRESKVHQIPKRFLDYAVVLLSLPLVVPLCLIIAGLIYADSNGPIFFIQDRHGRNGKIFRMYKFRTMYAHVCDPQGGAHAVANDNRVTRIGKWLRLYSLDELPQFINILLGDMTLVGPRAHAVQHNVHYSEKICIYNRRHAVTPGMTGWAQIHGFRGEISCIETMYRRVLCDIDYVGRRSLWLDIKIIFMTFGILLFPGRVPANIK